METLHCLQKPPCYHAKSAYRYGVHRRDWCVRRNGELLPPLESGCCSTWGFLFFKPSFKTTAVNLQLSQKTWHPLTEYPEWVHCTSLPILGSWPLLSTRQMPHAPVILPMLCSSVVEKNDQGCFRLTNRRCICQGFLLFYSPFPDNRQTIAGPKQCCV